MARGVLQLSALRENCKYFCWVLLLSLSSVTKDIAVTIAALCSSKNELSSSWGFSRCFVTVSSNQKIPHGCAGAETCRSGRVSSGTWGGAGRELLLPWQRDGLCLWPPGAVPLSPALLEAGRKEGLLAGLHPPKAARLSRAVLTCLSEHGSLTLSLLLGLGFAAGFSG